MSLVPFLERELIDTLPYVVASTLINFPSSLVEDVVDVLCWNLLPFAIRLLLKLVAFFKFVCKLSIFFLLFPLCYNFETTENFYIEQNGLVQDYSDRGR